MASSSKDTKTCAAVKPVPMSSAPPPPCDLPLGLMSPASWVPYMQLMRLDRPAGFIGFYMPSVLGLVYAASLGREKVEPMQLLWGSGFFLVANIFIRGAACTWNDNIDQEYDRQVLRCRQRPIARRAVSTTQAHVFLAVQLVVLAMLFNPLPRPCAAVATVMGALYALYPFCKRFTHYPQAILGVPLALSIVISAYSLDIDVAFFNARNGPATLALCAAEVFWTMIYDTIYAHQDLPDDVRAGVKSMAVRFRHCTKPLCSLLAVLQLALLTLAGVWTDMPAGYFLVGVSGTAVALAVMIASVELDVPASCARWFKLGFCFVGGSMNGGFLVAYLESWWFNQS
ncbi:4-hydroxybenzoate octaprenyltransferase [Aspergillus melleus]|uniref:4-hydroxybenzoate octaprenyltransferase n=1 Tax=Aspergillus melleus TaxID=138277 RepID=UPI001E8CBB5B|nr:Para-hydroxybenzoate--polyprenyltransferase, mitochondrial precursor (PHB:polyprenyltransferase) [Aspergillus melleus]KAH8433915.1 Para-hydroxybenzoate--polyprenyltransferase, mitochondrial precursor (PHB:polyprenyltransferase) [Aspergillus melleus]